MTDPRAEVVALWEQMGRPHPEDATGPLAERLWEIAGEHGLDPCGIVLDVWQDERGTEA